MKFSEIVKEYIDLRIEDLHAASQYSHNMSFNMMEQRRLRVEFLEQEMDKKVLDSEEKV